MVAHSFDATSFPSCANFFLKQTACDFGHLYPPIISKMIFMLTIVWFLFQQFNPNLPKDPPYKKTI